MYKNVIFDLDGTLINTASDLAAAGNYALSKFELPPLSEEKYKIFTGDGITSLVERCFLESINASIIKDREKDFFFYSNISKMKNFFLEYYKEHSKDKTLPYDGILMLLNKLKEKKIKASVLSNKDHNFTTELVDSLFGKELFAEVLGAYFYLPKKPAPHGVHVLLEKMGATKKDTLYVGDTPTDIETAKNAGIKVCAVTWGFREKKEIEAACPDYIAHTPEEIFVILTEDN